MLAIKTVQTWNEMQSTNLSIVGRNPMFALDHIEPKLSFLFFGNAMKRQRTIHPSTSTPYNNNTRTRAKPDQNDVYANMGALEVRPG